MRNIYPLGNHSFDLDNVGCVGPTYMAQYPGSNLRYQMCPVYMNNKPEAITVCLNSWQRKELVAMVEERKAVGERARSAFVTAWEASTGPHDANNKVLRTIYIDPAVDDYIRGLTVRFAITQDEATEYLLRLSMGLPVQPLVQRPMGKSDHDDLAKTFWTVMMRHQYPDIYDTSADPMRAEDAWDDWDHDRELYQDSIRVGVAAVVTALQK